MVYRMMVVYTDLVPGDVMTSYIREYIWQQLERTQELTDLSIRYFAGHVYAYN